jgi:hypothetical protein
MIAEIFPQIYDAAGKQVSHPFHGRKVFHPTFPMGRYVSQPLSMQCKTIEEIRNFLLGCKAVTDEELFGKTDYWEPPDEFEKRKAGDCEDFSFWTWRQLLAMGYETRIVFGRAGRYGIGHAWVEFFEDGKCFLLEPQARFVGIRLPRLSTLRYEPRFSVAWNGKTFKYYAHKNQSLHLPFRVAILLIPEWTFIYGWTWIRTLAYLPYGIAKRILKKKHKTNASE